MSGETPEGVTSVRAEELRREFATAGGIDVSDVGVVVSPYRICPLGAHCDHQGGPVIGCSIDAHTLLAFAPNDAERRSISLTSANYDGVVDWQLGAGREVAEEARLTDPCWAGYVWAAAQSFETLARSSTSRGFVGRVEGALPGSGLSSSASVLLAYLEALARVNGLVLTDSQRVSLALLAEREFMQVSVGILDPASIVAGQRGAMLVIDTEQESWRPIRLGSDAGECSFLVVYSGTARHLATTPYNARVKECFQAVELLSRKTNRTQASGLNAFTDEEFERYRSALPEVPGRRATHFFAERGRVRRGIDFWESGDLASFGDLMNESCQSSIENWESGSPELIAIQDCLEQTSGVIGSRFSGAGFGGCVVALVRRTDEEQVAERVRHIITKRLAELGDGVRIFAVRTDNGIRLA